MLKLKHLSFVLFLSLFSNLTFSQFNLTSFQHFNPARFNPAMVGINDNKVFTFFIRGEDETNSYLGYELPARTLNSNLGFSVDRIKDKLSQSGKSIQNKFGIAYNYKFIFSESNQIRIGFQFSTIAATRFFNPSQQKNWTVVTDYNMGIVYVLKKLKIGISALNILNHDIERSSRFPSSIDENRYFTLSYSYQFQIGQRFNLSPSLLFQMEKKEITQQDFTLQASYKNKYFLGAIYRGIIKKGYQSNIIGIALFGIQFREKLNFQLAFSPSFDSEDAIQFFTQYKF